MGFKNYLEENQIENDDNANSFTDRLQENWSAIKTLNKLNRIPDHQKTNLALVLERAIREKITKEKENG